jgi:hypothetical protein
VLLYVALSTKNIDLEIEFEVDTQETTTRLHISLYFHDLFSTCDESLSVHEHLHPCKSWTPVVRLHQQEDDTPAAGASRVHLRLCIEE